MKPTITRFFSINNSKFINNNTSEKTMQIRSANNDDLSNLRKWKNAQREFFFYKEEISAEKQIEWFSAYQNRLEDYIFMVIVNEKPIGCMGIRLIDEVWDIYNVILGIEEFGGKGYMSSAFKEMLGFALGHHQVPITLQVLKHNPAVSWYQKKGFVITSEQPDYFCMLYQPENFKKDNL